MLIIFETVSPPCKNVCHLNKALMAQGFFAVWLLDQLEHFASGAA
jgi:hypothetical protein